MFIEWTSYTNQTDYKARIEYNDHTIEIGDMSQCTSDWKSSVSNRYYYACHVPIGDISQSSRVAVFRESGIPGSGEIEVTEWSRWYKPYEFHCPNPQLSGSKLGQVLGELTCLKASATEGAQ